MTRRTRTPILIVTSVLALAGCAHRAGTPGAPRSSGQAGFGTVDGQSPTPAATATVTQDAGSTGGGNHTPSPKPSTADTGPRIVSFTATGAVCPVDPGVGGYSRPGQVTIAWKIANANANADTVDVLMDGGLWKSYPGDQGSDTLNFECSLNPPRQKVTHTYTLVIKNTNVKKTVSASAYSNPR